MPVTVSLAMIARDDARTIAAALDSAAPFCDEMIVVDLGSRDRTREIAGEHGAVVHDAAWHDDFAAARNESFDRCSGDWIVWLNADDVIPPQAQAAFGAFKESLAEQLVGTDVVIAPYHWRLDGAGAPVITFHRERVVRRAAGLRWEGRAHERLPAAEHFGLTGDLVVENRPDPERLSRAFNEVVAILEKSYEEGDRTPRTLFNLANDFYDQGRYGEAVDRYRDYLDAAPDGADRYWSGVYLAESLLVLEEPDEARRVLLATIADDPSRAEAYVVMGRTYFDEESWTEALPLFTAATGATRPSVGLVREADYTYSPWDYLAVCFEKLGQPQNGLIAAQRALPGNPQADRVRANMRWMVDHL